MGTRATPMETFSKSGAQLAMRHAGLAGSAPAPAPAASVVSPMRCSRTEDYCFMRAMLMVMRLPLEPCMQLRLPSFCTNQFADVSCSR